MEGAQRTYSQGSRHKWSGRDIQRWLSMLWFKRLSFVLHALLRFSFCTPAHMKTVSETNRVPTGLVHFIESTLLRHRPAERHDARWREALFTLDECHCQMQELQFPVASEA